LSKKSSINLREKMILHLVESLKEKDWRGKIRFLRQLLEFQEDVKIAINEISDLLFDDDFRVRERAACVLKNVGSSLKTILPKLTKAFHEETNTTVKTALIELLGLTKDNQTVEILEEELKKAKDDFIKQAIIEALSIIETEEAIKIILNSLEHDPAPNVRFAAANGLRWVHIKEKIPPLLKALHDNDPLVRAGAAWALATIDENEEVVTVLLNVLENEEDDYVKYDIIKALGEIGSEKAIPKLTEIALKKNSPKIRAKAIEALGAIATRKAHLALLEIYKKTCSKNIKYLIEKEMKDVDDDIGEEFVDIKKEKSQEMTVKRRKTKDRILINYQTSELREILTTFRTISIDLLAGWLKIDGNNKLVEWLQQLPTNLGLRLNKGYEYDSLVIQMPKEYKIAQKKIEEIITNFRNFFSEK